MREQLRLLPGEVRSVGEVLAPPMLEWLGITLYVSSWKRDAKLEADGRAELERSRPLQTDDPTAEHVHRWLCGRLSLSQLRY